jgi:predicted CoA-substrate-specific enzyme activase
MIKVLGICLGAWSLSFAHIRLDNNNIIIDKLHKIIHNGNPQKYLKKYLTANNSNDTKIVATGRKFRKIINTTNISETEASEYALSFLVDKYSYTNIDVIASLGAETFLVYNLDNEQHIKNVNTKNKCASGTGEFFLQQIKRMDITIDDVRSFFSDVDIYKNIDMYKVSGRCSVFCKSDCTHALNKGVEKSKVVAGLSQMLADKIIELLPHNHQTSILIVGGVNKNKLVIDFLRKIYPNCIIPPEADYFEAIGAGIYGIKNYIHNYTYIKNYSDIQLFKHIDSNFSFHPPLKNYIDKVTFEINSNREIVSGEECILGLDVGSTTTKVVLLATSDNSILASKYIYTNGNPIEASRECYVSLLDCDVQIIGVGTTGSGRQITGLHSDAGCIVNEITAHSNAAVFYARDVDTIFEIGGQDAKYSYIINQVPIDYAMNEACSAGTGSFIEEAAFESLGVHLQDIEKLAMIANNPPNFSDQCAAFISSDIKTAQQEGISRANIIAGLVYSICYNYLNRVVGNRKIGKKIFMQGGVCYNKAIPIAMAAISERTLIVPPEPGLMGAFGVALEVKKRIDSGIIQEKEYDLLNLINRNVKELPSFICRGGKERCDIKCSIATLEINGKKYPFGGACDKYNRSPMGSYPLVRENGLQPVVDYVRLRNKIIFDK